MGTRLSQIAQIWWIRHQRSPARVVRWLLLWALMWTAILLATPLALAGRLAGVRFLGINYRRIGHLAVEPDCFVKERALGLHRGVIPFACAPRNRVCNCALLDCWKPHIRWITAPWLCAALKPLEWHPLLAFDVSSYAMEAKGEGGCGYVSIPRRWQGRNPVIALPDHVERAGAAALLQLGLPAGAWFACVHNREGSYSPLDEDWHSYRNCTIDSYVPAMREIVDAGGWCIRIGDPSSTRLQALPNTIDYAHHALRTDWLDLYLLAHCRFFMGSSSGPFLVACIFNRPVALANLTPIEVTLPYGYADLGIPKLMHRDGRADRLGFVEMFEHPSSGYRFSEQFAKEGLVLVDNSPDEIRDLASEMLQRLQGAAIYTEDDERLQEAFKGLMRPSHASYGSASRVGRDFIRKHRRLLP